MSEKKIAIAGIIVGLIAASVWGKHIFTGTPRYSLGQLQQAISEQNTAEIKEYVDTEAVAAQIVDVTLASAQQQAIAENDIFGILGNSLGIVDMIRPQMQTQIENVISQGLQGMGKSDLKDLELTSIERNNENAIATFDLSKLADGEKMPFKSLEIQLEQQVDRKWEIKGLSKDSLKTVTEAIEKSY